MHILRMCTGLMLIPLFAISSGCTYNYYQPEAGTSVMGPAPISEPSAEYSSTETTTPVVIRKKTVLYRIH